MAEHAPLRRGGQHNNTMWSVYILRSIKDNGLYIGCTSNLRRRINTHNNGENKSTKHRAPFELCYIERYASRVQAFAREKEIKSYKGGNALKRLLDN
jgi:putative endonuclease